MTKASELRDMTDKELDQKLAEARKELFNLRFQMAAGQLENTHRLKLLRRDIARILTIKHAKEIFPEEGEAKKEVVKVKKESAVKAKKEEALKESSKAEEAGKGKQSEVK